MSSVAGEPIPRGVAYGDLAYVSGPGGELLLLHVSSGDIIARTSFAARALAADAAGVIGWRSGPGATDQRGEFGVILFAAQLATDSVEVVWEARLDFPAWVGGSASDLSRFAMDVQIEAGVVKVTVDAYGRYQGGAAPPMAVEAAATRELHRVVRLDRQSGCVLAGDRINQSPEIGTLLDEPIPGRRPVPYQFAETPQTRTWSTATGRAQLVRGPEGSGVHLARAVTASSAPPVEMVLSEDARSRTMVSLDGRWVFAEQTPGHGAPWGMYSAESGECVGDVVLDEGTISVAVIGGSVLLLVKEVASTAVRWTLRCRDRTDSRERWSLLLEERADRSAPPLSR